MPRESVTPPVIEVTLDPPAGHRVPVIPGNTLFESLPPDKLPFRSDCGGKGLCGKCRIQADRPECLGSPSLTEKKWCSPADPRQRLACQARILDGPVRITISDPLIPVASGFAKTGLTGTFATPPAGVRPRIPGRNSLGVACDIGTTTIATYLCDLTRGTLLASHAEANPQRGFGDDVISRITAILRDPENLGRLQKAAADTMNRLIHACLTDARARMDQIDDITIVGNTTMQHIIAGLNPGSLGSYPFQPVTPDALTLPAQDLGLSVRPDVRAYIFPVISGFLGGDILAACLGDGSHTRTDTSTLLIDIGTNGELMLCAGHRAWAASCATGPALEGAQISCGMRAYPGAISRVHVDGDTLTYTTIADAPATGICGSGVIDLLAALRQTRALLPDGRFTADCPWVFRDDSGMGKGISLPGLDLQFLLKDVRQVQLAKAALSAGIDILIETAGAREVRRTVLTGAFGSRFDWHTARDIGLLPRTICTHEVVTAENLAGTGAILALLDPARRREVESLARQVTVVELASSPEFVRRFAQATRFPDLPVA